MTSRAADRIADIIVVVPARDEADRIARCLRSVRISLERAARAGAVNRVVVAVVGHRCADDSLGQAERVLRGLPHVLIADDLSKTVGEVRALGVRAALDLVPGRDAWILNTDADSVVPATWVTDVLTHARGGQHAVVGMARLDSRSSPGPVGLQSRSALSRASCAYHAIISAGLHGLSHDHVYGANLAVRTDAYQAVGGFSSVSVGEDRALLEALVEHERPLVRPRAVVVTTSARREGRAIGGLATLLDTLDHAFASGTGCRLPQEACRLPAVIDG